MLGIKLPKWLFFSDIAPFMRVGLYRVWDLLEKLAKLSAPA
jgi:hypothetical protein